MTSWVVVDSGVFLATVFDEPLSDKADALITSLEAQNVHFNAPHLFKYEIISVIRKHVHRGTLSVGDAQAGLDVLLAKEIELIFDSELLNRAYVLAAQLNQPTAYDAQYLAVAEHLGCDFWTADKRLFNAASGQFGWVKWIGDFEIEDKQSP